MVIIKLGGIALGIISLFLVGIIMGLSMLPKRNVEYCKEPQYEKPPRPGEKRKG